MGCLCSLKVRDDKIPASIVGPILVLAGAVGMVVDYLGIGTYGPWWYSAAILVGGWITVRSLREWKKRAAAESQTPG
ncbi:MAG TPA: hypothetical protein VMB75_03510 [Rhodocyclaceae bacterium]|nr:hypothetical protein [Rhodocyclaceae bacterium]